MREDFEGVTEVYGEVYLRPDDDLVSSSWEFTESARDSDDIVSTTVKGYTMDGVEDSNLVSSYSVIDNVVYVILDWPENGAGQYRLIMINDMGGGKVKTGVTEKIYAETYL